jgi:hypothetical protein
MPMNARSLTLAVGIALFCTACGEQPAGRPEWDQAKAVALVKKALAVEATGRLPWDDIAWLTDADTAIARARAEEKPILVFYFVKNPGPENGPAAAPC